ncbi:hypothetical protein LUZ60_007650 [Juncus effusus]|nr:hypothetical protein LUZ60_007650 [Juncus effusus]
MASLPSSKKPKTKTKTLNLEQVRRLGEQLLSSRSHLNNLPLLLTFISPSSPSSLALESVISLQSFFVPLISEIKPPGNDDVGEEADSVFKTWLKDRFDEFVAALVEMAVSSQTDDAIREVALDAIMEFVKLGKDGSFQASSIYNKFLKNIVNAISPVDSLVNLLESKYFNYADVRYFTYITMEKMAKVINETDIEDSTKPDSENKYRNDMAIRHLYAILSSFPPLDFSKEPNYEMWTEQGISSKEGKQTSSKPSTSVITKKLKLKFTKAWLAILKLPLPLDLYKEVLATLHENVIPNLSNPAILCDFLTRSYDIGGVISVMALSGLFILMTKHGLEYANFYEKLYALLTPSVFLAKHRAVFLQLLDSCLKSSYLPAYLAAAFTKKLSRLSLSVQPAGAIIIIALIHNLLRRHPSIHFLVHQDIEEDAKQDNIGEATNESESNKPIKNKEKLGIDQFNYDEKDPAKSNAMRSSLFEIDTLRHHYSPAVSRFVASLENDLTVKSKTTEMRISDFSSGSYATVFRDEIRRRIKQVPLAFYRVTPTSLFSESDFPGWTFESRPEDEKSVKRQRVES